MSKTHILRYDGTPITDIETATWHPKDIFWNFFDVDKIQISLQEQKLQTMWRLCYIDKYRIRVLGYKIVRANRKRKNGRVKLRSEEEQSYSSQFKTTLYSQLKEARGKADSLYLEIQEEEQTIALKQKKLYHLNRKLTRCPSTCSNNLSGEGLVQELLYEHLQGQRNVGITGIDPGRVTTATISTKRIRSLFEDINRFEALQEDTDQIADIDTDVERCPKPVELKTGLIENATFRTVHRALRDQGQETNVNGSLTKLEQTLKAPEPDKLYTIDKYNTTKTCGYCFKKIQIHKYRRDGIFVRVKGAVSCPNPRCPSRIVRHTTCSRDAVAASNIALSSISRALSDDNQPLPCFRRGQSKDMRFSLTQKFQLDCGRTRLVTDRSFSRGKDLD
ncbi:hypothetical protein VTP01DRAFT_6884 [Rhizomucor pusillus]|uniref:uncharacterized protein n=1 Tax=Rhizomucor pusillus TaxID=4840 RepID=UPI00374222DE